MVTIRTSSLLHRIRVTSGLSLPAAVAAWAEFRASRAFQDLVADCALWTAPWTGVQPYKTPDCAEEFNRCAALGTDIVSYDEPGGTKALPPDR